MKKINIAIDGFSSCGKSTIAKKLAKKLEYLYIDSGAMYRAITFFCMQNNIIDSNRYINEEKLKKIITDIHIRFKINSISEESETFVNNKNIETEIRKMNVSQNVSKISSIPFVREYLVSQQREFGQKKGVVMDGRDIGTVVFPDAELKIFLTASPHIRAKRRFDELTSKGYKNISLEEVLENINERDFIDQNRKESPLIKAKDAIEIDNSNKTIEECLEIILNLFYKNK